MTGMMRSRCLLAAISIWILLAPAAHATEFSANGWRVKKYSRELWTACGLVVRYYVEVERTGSAVAGVVPFTDYRSFYSEQYLNGTVVTYPALIVQAGDTNANL